MLQGLVTREGTQHRSGTRRASLPQEAPAWPSITRPPPGTAVTAKLVFAGAFGGITSKIKEGREEAGSKMDPAGAGGVPGSYLPYQQRRKRKSSEHN